MPLNIHSFKRCGSIVEVLNLGSMDWSGRLNLYIPYIFFLLTMYERVYVHFSGGEIPLVFTRFTEWS